MIIHAYIPDERAAERESHLDECSCVHDVHGLEVLLIIAVKAVVGFLHPGNRRLVLGDTAHEHRHVGSGADL